MALEAQTQDERQRHWRERKRLRRRRSQLSISNGCTLGDARADAHNNNARAANRNNPSDARSHDAPRHEQRASLSDNRAARFESHLQTAREKIKFYFLRSLFHLFFLFFLPVALVA